MGHWPESYWYTLKVFHSLGYLTTTGSDNWLTHDFAHHHILILFLLSFLMTTLFRKKERKKNDRATTGTIIRY